MVQLYTTNNTLQYGLYIYIFQHNSRKFHIVLENSTIYYVILDCSRKFHMVLENSTIYYIIPDCST